MQWHELLMDYGNEPEPLIVLKMMTKYCIPYMKTFIQGYDGSLLNQTKHLLSVTNQLLDYTASSSPIFKVYIT
jgi:hypothetical protein